MIAGVIFVIVASFVYSIPYWLEYDVTIWTHDHDVDVEEPLASGINISLNGDYQRLVS